MSKAYLDVLIYWLQSFYNSMHGHCAPEDTRDQELADAFDLFDVTSSDAANVESIVRKEFSLYQRECLKYAHDCPVLSGSRSVRTDFRT